MRLYDQRRHGLGCDDQHVRAPDTLCSRYDAVDDRLREWLRLRRLIPPEVGVAGVGGVLRAATSCRSSTLQTVCVVTEIRCTSCEHGHAKIARTDWEVWLLRSMIAGPLEGRREVSSFLLGPEYVR